MCIHDLKKTHLITRYSPPKKARMNLLRKRTHIVTFQRIPSSLENRAASPKRGQYKAMPPSYVCSFRKPVELQSKQP